MLKRVTVPPVVKRLTVREYIPLGLSIATWAMIGLAIGHADAVRLLAANTFVQAARTLCTLELTPVFKSRIGASAEILRASRRTAMRIELAGLLGAVLLTFLTAAFLEWRGMEVAAAMVAILALAIPARHPGGVFVLARERVAAWRLGAALVGAAGAAAILILGLEWWMAALVFALRDWGGLLATALLAPKRPVSRVVATEPLSFREAAGQTESTARRRLTYRIGKSMLAGVLGPFGSIAARTGRGVRIDHKLSRYIPRHRLGFVVFTGATLMAGIGFLWLSREPAALLLGAAFLRIAASGASALLWWSYASPTFDEDEDDDD